MKEFIRETEHGNLYLEVEDGYHPQYTLVSNFTGRKYPSCVHGSTVDIKDGGGSVKLTDGQSGTERNYCMLCIMDYISSKIPEL